MLTKPKPPRLSGFKSLTGADFSALEGIIAKRPRSRAIAHDTAALEKYNTDWLQQVRGSASLALFPSTTAEVQEILRYCNRERIAVCPQGGNTGLVYGSVPVHDEVILSLDRMDAPPAIHPETMSATCEAGVTLARLQEAAEPLGLLPPLDMGSKGSCTIGGNIATAAGGIHFARYGSLRANTLGLEVVRADGTLLPMMSALRKDNTGYDLKQLFIGSEGTLGVVTRAELRMFPLPASTQVALCAVRSFADLLTLRKLAEQHLGEVLSAFEVMDYEGCACLERRRPGALPFKLADPAHICVLIETHGSASEHDCEKLVALEEAASALLAGSVIAQSESQARALWHLREGLPVELASSGVIYKFDLTFPFHRFNELVEETRALLRARGCAPEEVFVCGFGHFGDGNLHLNVVDAARRHEETIKGALYPWVYEETVKRGGSVSAEHCIGIQKKEYLRLQKPAACMELMGGIKAHLDPRGILNPYKVL